MRTAFYYGTKGGAASAGTLKQQQKGKRSMKNITKLLVAAGVVGLTAILVAQDNPPAGDNGPQGGYGGPRGPGGPGGHRPPPIALLAALDANHDGVIDADEIANASEALKKLDKNGDGKLTPDEFIGMRPFGHGPGGPGGPPPPGGPDG